MRVLLTILLPLILPTVIYFLWRAARRLAIVTEGATLPWPWLLGAGVALTAITLVIVSVQFGAAPTGKYVPPRVIDGQVEPAHVNSSPAIKP
jgi:Family of unknown function (DUF6111)